MHKNEFRTHNALNRKIYYKGVDGKTLFYTLFIIFTIEITISIVITRGLLLFLGLFTISILLFISFLERYSKKVKEKNIQDPLLQEFYLIEKSTYSFRDTTE